MPAPGRPARPLQDARPAPAPPPPAAVAAWAGRLGSTSARTSKWTPSRRAMARRRRPGGHSGPALTFQPCSRLSFLPTAPLLLSVLGGPARRIPSTAPSRPQPETTRGTRPLPGRELSQGPTGRLSPQLPAPVPRPRFLF